MSKLFIAMPVKYTGINLVNNVVRKLDEYGCSVDYELHVLFNGDKKSSVYYKQFSLIKGIKLHCEEFFHNILTTRVKLIREFLKSNCSHLLMLDPDDLHRFTEFPKLDAEGLANVHRYGCPFNSEVITPEVYELNYRLRNFSIYHVWHSIFDRYSMEQCINDLEHIIENYEIDHSEDFLINMVCFKNPLKIQFHTHKFVSPVYDNNPYSNYSKNTIFNHLFMKEQDLFKALDEVGVFKSELEREFHYNKIMTELAIHCYTRTIKKLPRPTIIMRDVRELC